VPAQQNSAITGSHTANRVPQYQEIKPEKELRRGEWRLSCRGGSGSAGQHCAQVTFVGVELALDEDRCAQAGFKPEDQRGNVAAALGEPAEKPATTTKVVPCCQPLTRQRYCPSVRVDHFLPRCADDCTRRIRDRSPPSRCNSRNVSVPYKLLRPNLWFDCIRRVWRSASRTDSSGHVIIDRAYKVGRGRQEPLAPGLVPTNREEH
jgi:hypothetical protein